MFQLAHEIEQWCQSLAQANLSEATRAELEDHLHCEIDRIMAQNVSPEQAFYLATQQLGAAKNLSREFAKTCWYRPYKHYFLGGVFATVSAMHFADFGLMEEAIVGPQTTAIEIFSAMAFMGLAICSFRKALRAGRPITG